jgi:hypothetical protein
MPGSILWNPPAGIPNDPHQGTIIAHDDPITSTSDEGSNWERSAFNSGHAILTLLMMAVQVSVE